LTSDENLRGTRLFDKLRQHAGLRRNSLLLLVLASFIVLLPFVQEDGFGEFIVRFGFSAVVVGGLYSASERRGTLVVAGVMAVLVLAVDWGSVLRKDPEFTILRSGLSAAFIFLTAWVQIAHLGRKREVTADTIMGAVNIYLLLIVAFMFLHTTLEIAKPGAYHIGDQTLTEYLMDPGADDTLAASTLIYFSITTFTTLGYGDILPVSSAARVISGFEAIVGQLYVAIIVARLVAMQISQRMQGRD